ncbi:right-handed parallel beta-helix repeat-containing protein [Mucilaginibacter sabulilitoris]|uniref:Right-handed parallel beta-helix repeat-containing protein n=1 Tax=Mucilaginibacter sabulilitoris TaxID=1173583 RepID=A0ABZ0TGP8_9SPHI|nr:right-handed parallel beta-helix repeat-containing protein [Mucilaginibacter sabulilitoris]WPU92370.1 right-handed parallel beta-helix repeat-containing protein [Mucilaginibacter sabulilitoris]
MSFSRIFIFVLLLNLLLTNSIFAAEIWVASNGSDKNSGTQQQPLLTVAMALRKARELRRLNDPSVKGGIHIRIEKGVYQLSEPLFIRPEDSGTVDNPTIIEGAADGQSVISGGINITGWHKLTSNILGLPEEAKGKVWEADAPLIGNEALLFRQLWINNNKAIRARETDAPVMNRILSWDHQNQTCWILKPKSSDLTHVKGMEMFIHQWWAIAMLRIKSVEVQGDSAKLSFYQPESRIQSEHPWPAPWISKKTGNSAFYLNNAMQFLNQPGEWYLDTEHRKVYYIPRPGEDMNTAEVTVPYLENIVKVEGTIDHPVSYVSFKNISFQHSTWLYPSKAGLVPHQAGMYMLDAYKLKIPGTPDKKGLENQAWVGRPAAAVEVSFAEHTTFEGCRFEHMASTGLDHKRGTHDNQVNGNLFKDIGGTAILTGVYSDEAVEVHLPYNPTDKREVCTNDRIENNLITDATNEDWGCVGIGAGYVKGITIAHNEVCDVNYTGISVGWGWTKTANIMSDNHITANKIHHYARNMYDVAGIYTLSAQPGSVISNNVVDSIYKAPYAHDPVHWFYLYCDEGSSYITVKNNWCPAEKFLQNANGPGDVWENNGPQVAANIKNTAGLEAPYQYLLKYRSVNPDNRPINHKIDTSK